MNDVGEPSLLAAGREELTGGFHPLLLWRDRQRILARPEIAAQPRPPLANAPMRFALALGLTPLLVVGWLTSVVVGLLPGERTERGGIEYRSETVIAALQPQLPGLSHEQLDTLRRSVPRSERLPEATTLADEAAGVAFFQPLLEPAQRRAELEAWAGRVRASSLPRAQQDMVFARILDSAHDMRRGDALMGALSRNVAEGGPLMQFLTLLSLIFGAWLFGQMLRGDARFPRADRGDSFYLYFTTSRLFWFVPAQAVAYGLVSYASASGNLGVMRSAQFLLMSVAAASMLYLVAGSRTMARALGGTGDVQPGGAWAICWRMLVAMAVASVVILFVCALVGIIVGIFSAATS